MPRYEHSALAPPGMPMAILRLLLPRAERDELLADVRVEYAHRAACDPDAARRWLWRQAIASAPSLLGWTTRRGLTGFEPRANAYRPGGPMLKSLFADIRYAARRLRARPGYTLISVLTLALGIGGVAAVYGIARPLVFDPLPYANGTDVTFFWFDGSWTEEEFVHLRGRFPGYRTVAAYRDNDVTLRTGDAPARLLAGITTSAELFDVLGTQPFMGRAFKPGEDAQGAAPTVVLSYGLWQELGADAQIVGKPITLDGTPRTVIGVMPRGFWFPDPSVQVWSARPLNPEGRNGSFTLVGHVAPGQNAQNMTAQTQQLARMLGERFTYGPEWDKTREPLVRPLREALLGEMRPALVATFVAMGLILLIACTNVAALMLGQTESRGTELAVRAALGASRRRLTQPLVVEALLIGVLAGLAGAGLAAAGFGLLARSLPLGAWGESATFDWTLFVASLVIAIVAALLVVLIPSGSLFRRKATADLHATLSRSRTGGVGAGGVKMEKGLVVAEVALAMLIASGAALLVRSVMNLYAIDPGFDPKGVAVVDIVASANLPSAERNAKLQELTTALKELPGVQTAAFGMKLPLRGNGNNFGIQVEGVESQERLSTFFRIGSQEYLQALGVRLRSGRFFDVSDQPDSTQLSVIINESLARKFFPNQDPIGRRVLGGFGVPQRIVGVVADAAEGDLLDEPKPARYYLATQAWFGNSASLVIKTKRPEDATVILDAARSTINRVAPEFAIQETTTMSRVFDKAVGPARQIMALLTLLSALALTLGAVGIYGVISHFAARRKRDWAIRVALGLPGHRVVSHMLGQGALLVLLGVTIGGFGTVALAKTLDAFLYGVGRVDPVAFALASAALLLTGVAAAYVPARRAGRVDPALVLRED